MSQIQFKYQKINKTGPSLTVCVNREQILNQSVIENESFAISQFPESFNPAYCYILVTIGEDGVSFLNTVMSHGIIETQLGHLPSKVPLFKNILV